MAIHTTALTSLDLKAAIVRNPLIVSPDTTVMKAIAQMSESCVMGTATQAPNSLLDELHHAARLSCVLVMEAAQVVGILTERDVVCLAAQQRSLDTLILREVMAAPVITLHEADFTDLLSVLNLLQQYRIRHLPLMGDRGQVTGLITYESLQHLLGQILSVKQAGSEVNAKAPKNGDVGTPTKQSESDWVPADHSRLELEQRITTPSGRKKWLKAAGRPLQEANGDILWDTLILDVSDRKAAEQALKIRRDFNQLIAEITSRFVDLSPDALDAEIERSLRLIGEITQVDQSFLFKFDENAHTMSMTHEWSKPGGVSQIEIAQAIPLEAFPWNNGRLKQRDIVHVSSVADLPAEAAIDQVSWQQLNLAAVLSIPLVQKSVVTGFMGFAFFSHAMNWEDEMIRLLHVIGQTIANAQERIQDNQRLLISEERLRLALRAANQGLYDLNLQTGDAIVTPEYAAMLGYNPATFKETNAEWIKRLHPDDHQRVAQTYQDYVAGFLPEYKVEFRQRTQTGDYKWILSLGKIVAWDDNGAPLRMLGTHTDISDRKQPQEALAASERRYRAIVEDQTELILRWKPDRSVLFVNNAYCRFYGVTRDGFIGQDFLTTVHESVKDGVRAALDILVRSLTPENPTAFLENQVIDATGQFYDYHFSDLGIFDADGRLIEIQTVGYDITARKRAEVALQESEMRFRQLAENIQEVFWMTDIEFTQCLYVSPAYELIWGHTCASLYEQPASFVEAIHSEDRDRAFAIMQHQRYQGWNQEYRLVQPDGTLRWIQERAFPVADDKGKIHRVVGVCQDISDRKAAEIALQRLNDELELRIEQRTAALQASEVRFRGFFDFAPIGIAVAELQSHQFIAVNQAFCQLLGYGETELLTLASCQSVSVADDWVLERPHAEALFRGDVNSYQIEQRYVKKTGEIIVGSLTTTVLRDQAGSITHFIAMVEDITQRKQAEEQLRKNDTHLKMAQRIGSLGSWEFDLPTGQISWSDEVFRIFGRDPAAGPPNFEELQQLLQPEHRDRHQQVVQTAIETIQAYEIEFQLYRPDGTLRHVQARGEPIVNATGQFIQLVGTILDITDHKQAEETLRNLSDRLAVAVKSGAIGIWDFNVMEHTLTWDDRMCQLYGITPDQFTHTYDDWSRHLHPDDRVLTETAVQQALTGEKDYDTEFRVVHPDGTVRFIKASALVQRNAQGEPLHIIGINFDITERKQAETKLLQITAELEASNRELEAFAYSVSHDLRSPLRAIDGFSRALIEDYGDQFDEAGKDYFDRIRSNVKRMGLLIDDLLHLSRVSRSEIQYSAVNLSALVQEQVKELAAAEPERQVSVLVAPGAIVSADASLMRVVISNLLQNAWKFTSHHATAHIEFGMMQQAERLTYYVRDDGAGFDMTYADMLFGVFQRLHNTDEFPGTGIGLATVQRAIHRHGGRVWADGAVEQGATIYFTVPHHPSVQELRS